MTTQMCRRTEEVSPTPLKDENYRQLVVLAQFIRVVCLFAVFI